MYDSGWVRAGSNEATRNKSNVGIASCAVWEQLARKYFGHEYSKHWGCPERKCADIGGNWKAELEEMSS